MCPCLRAWAAFSLSRSFSLSVSCRSSQPAKHGRKCTRRSAMAEALPQGLLARFASPERLLEAVHAAKQADMHGIDAYTPFPVDEVNEALGLPDRRIPWLGFRSDERRVGKECVGTCRFRWC